MTEGNKSKLSNLFNKMETTFDTFTKPESSEEETLTLKIVINRDEKVKRKVIKEDKAKKEEEERLFKYNYFQKMTGFFELIICTTNFWDFYEKLV
jgi:hypothetical protein